MKKIRTVLILILVLFTTKQQLLIAQNLSFNSEEFNTLSKIEGYVNSVDSYIYHINVSSKDTDSITIKELHEFDNSRRFKKNVTEKKVTYSKSKIVKVKYKDFLQNTFYKIKSFYYDNDSLVCVKITELLPDGANSKMYTRKIYYHNNKVLFDTKKQDVKYQPSSLQNFGLIQLEEEYQSKLND